MNKNEFFEKIKEIEGMGDSKVQSLYDSGYTSIEKLEEASIGELAKIEGISRRVAKNLLHSLFPEKFEKEEKIEEEKSDIKSSESDESLNEDSDNEEVEIVDKGIPKVSKRKPVLSEEESRLLSVRSERKKKEPKFLRQEWFRYPRLGKKWRKPRGLHSKMRKNLRYRPPMARAGFGTPDEIRGRHPSGFHEVMVYNVKGLEDIDPEKEAARISSKVGYKKRKDIIDAADGSGIRVLNRGL